jgi:hypothetical protein
MTRDEQMACDLWNARHPVGTAVLLREDDGRDTLTKTRSEAWVMGGHTAVVMVEGKRGGWDLERLRSVEVDEL